MFFCLQNAHKIAHVCLFSFLPQMRYIYCRAAGNLLLIHHLQFFNYLLKPCFRRPMFFCFSFWLQNGMASRAWLCLSLPQMSIYLRIPCASATSIFHLSVQNGDWMLNVFSVCLYLKPVKLLHTGFSLLLAQMRIYIAEVAFCFPSPALRYRLSAQTTT
jgi:hypothetical protein